MLRRDHPSAHRRRDRQHDHRKAGIAVPGTSEGQRIALTTDPTVMTITVIMKAYLTVRVFTMSLSDSRVSFREVGLFIATQA